MRRIGCFLLSLIATLAIADESPVDISGIATKDVRLYYYDWLSDLAPYTLRTFTNSLAWQRKHLGWEPSEPTTILLQDFADYGNTFAYIAPRGMLVVEVSPLNRTFETSPASERMYSTMNHELIHVVQGDSASEEERR